VTVYRFSRVEVVSVHDGDTARFRLASEPVDVGFGMLVSGATDSFSCRLIGYAARELSDPGGPEAREALAALLGTGAGLVVESVRWDKYGGRFDGIVTTVRGPVAALMIASGWGVAWDGRGPQPKPAWPRTILAPPG
jgi:endonuclease YncB( thermonuclease family)